VVWTDTVIIPEYCVCEIRPTRLQLQTWRRYEKLRLCETNLTETRWVSKCKFLFGEIT